MKQKILEFGIIKYKSTEILMAKKYVNHHVGCDHETGINSKHEHNIYFNAMLLMDYNNQLIILSLLCRRH